MVVRRTDRVSTGLRADESLIDVIEHLGPEDWLTVSDVRDE